MKAPTSTAVVLSPGMPRESSGMSAPPVSPLLEASLATSPSTHPVPYFSGRLEKFFACEYESRDAALPPTPGRIPTKVPMNADRNRLTTCPLKSENLKPRTSRERSAPMASSRIPPSASCKICTRAKRPMSTGSSWKPLRRSTERKSGTMRILLLSANWPIREKKTPRNPAKTPVTMFPLERAAMIESAKRMIRNFSTEEKLRATLASGGVKRKSSSRLKRPPKREAVMPIRSALTASPRLAIG